MSNTFGAYFKQMRLRRGLTLRSFCEKNQYDPGNISRLERGVFGPPGSHEKLEEYARALRLKKGSDEWLEFFDRAAASRGQIPKDLLSDKALTERLPLLYRTLRGQKVPPEKLDELVELIRASNRHGS